MKTDALTNPIVKAAIEALQNGGRLVAKAASTCMALKGERAKGR